MFHTTATHRLTVLAGGSAALLGVAVLAGHSAQAESTPAAASRAPTTEVMLLDLPFVGGHQHYVDNGRKGLGPGDLFLVTGAPVYTHGTTEVVGRVDAAELIVSASHDGTVTGESTMRLRGGHIVTDCIVRHTDDPNRCAVVGGTGDYSGVRGQVTMLREDRVHKVTVLKVELTP